MNRHLCIALLLTATTAPAIAQESSHPLTTVQVRGALYVAECNHRVLPSQREVGEWTGLHNLGQVYAARERLVADIGRVCRRPGVARVQVVKDDGSGEGARYVAVALPGR